MLSEAARAGEIPDSSSESFELHLVYAPSDGDYNVNIVSLGGKVTSPMLEIGPVLLDFPGRRRVLVRLTPEAHSTQERLAVHHLSRGSTTRIAGVGTTRASGTTVASLDGNVFAWRMPSKHRKDPIVTAFAHLSRPGKVLWRARFDAVALNPTEKRVLGWKTRTFTRDEPERDLAIRRTSDGKLLAKLHHGLQRVDYDQIRWEDADHVLVVNGGTVVRCGISGQCATILDGEGTVDLPGRR